MRSGECASSFQEKCSVMKNASSSTGSLETPSSFVLNQEDKRVFCLALELIPSCGMDEGLNEIARDMCAAGFDAAGISEDEPAFMKALQLCDEVSSDFIDDFRSELALSFIGKFSVEEMIALKKIHEIPVMKKLCSFHDPIAHEISSSWFNTVLEEVMVRLNKSSNPDT